MKFQLYGLRHQDIDIDQSQWRKASLTCLQFIPSRRQQKKMEISFAICSLGAGFVQTMTYQLYRCVRNQGSGGVKAVAGGKGFASANVYGFHDTSNYFRTISLSHTYSFDRNTLNQVGFGYIQTVGNTSAQAPFSWSDSGVIEEK